MDKKRKKELKNIINKVIKSEDIDRIGWAVLDLEKIKFDADPEEFDFMGNIQDKLIEKLPPKLLLGFVEDINKLKEIPEKSHIYAQALDFKARLLKRLAILIIEKFGPGVTLEELIRLGKTHELVENNKKEE